jgi:hypothetical protein
MVTEDIFDLEARGFVLVLVLVLEFAGEDEEDNAATSD